MRKLLPALLLLTLLAAPVRAGDDVTAAEAKEAVRVFRKAFGSESMDVRMEALKELAGVRHPLAVDEIGGRVLRDEDEEVRAAAAMILGKVRADPERAGPHLARELPRNEETPEVQIAIVRAIGDVGYLGARDALMDAALRFLEEDYRFVTDEVLRTFGRLKDVKALPFMLKMAEFPLMEPSRGKKGPRKRYSGRDSEATKRWKWMREFYAKYGIPKDDPGIMECPWLQELIAAAEKITGKKIEELIDLRAWMEEHAKELKFTKKDLDKKVRLTPKKPKKPPEEEGK